MKKIVFFLFSISCFGQAGTLDLSFNAGNPGGGNCLAVQSDGKILVGGGFSVYNGFTVSGLVRLNPDGSVDPSFAIGSGTLCTNCSANPEVYDLLIQPDGKILVVGYFYRFNNTSVGGIVRLNSDGTLDSSFNPIRVFSKIHSVALQSDGKIIIVGDFLGLSTYNPDGTLQFSSIGRCAARLNADGTFDNTFTVGEGPLTSYGPGTCYKVAVQADDKILIGGQFSTFNGKYGRNLVRLNSNGSVDTSFEVFAGFDGRVRDIDILPDQTMVITGDFSNFDIIPANRVIKLLQGGNKDFSFTPQVSFGQAFNAEIQTNGKIIMCASSFPGPYVSTMLRMNPDGTTDTSFLTGTTFGGAITTRSALQSDGKIIFLGGFVSYNGIPIRYIARIIGDPPVLLGSDENKPGKLTIYPNPASNQINLSSTDNTLLDNIIISDMTGKVLIEKTCYNNSIPVENLANGLYVIQAFSGENKYQSKFIKE